MARQRAPSSESMPLDPELSGSEDVYSPLSNYSTYSHEVKYIFDPIPDIAEEDSDYSHIPPRHKGVPAPSRTPSDVGGSSHYSASELGALGSLGGSTGMMASGSSSSYGHGVASPSQHYSHHEAALSHDFYMRDQSTPPGGYIPDNCNVSMSSSSGFYSTKEAMIKSGYHGHVRENSSYSSASTSGYYSRDRERDVRDARDMRDGRAPSTSSGGGSAYPYCPIVYGTSRRRASTPPALPPLQNSSQQQQQPRHSQGSEGVEGEDVAPGEDSAPPRLAPVSGVLPSESGRGLIRPKAFKPISGRVGSQHPILSPRHAGRRLSNQEELRLHHHQHPSSLHPYPGHPHPHHFHHHHRMNSSATASERAASVGGEGPHPPGGRPESLPSFNLSRISTSGMDAVFVQTPSPSDSGVGELEAMLKEKDAELNTLREVMDKNERAIFLVYEEKRQAWSRELRELREEYEKKLKVNQRQMYKTEQVLSMQVYKLQEEKGKLASELEKVQCQREVLRKQCDSLQEEVEQLQGRMDRCSCGCREEDGQQRGASPRDEVAALRKQLADQREEILEKNAEILSLQKQVQSSQQELTGKNQELALKFREILAKTEELKVLKNRLGSLSAEEPSLQHADVQTDLVICLTPIPDSNPEGASPEASLQRELLSLREQLSAKNVEFDKEKDQWLEEKNKVVRYQKQLQLNYVQMFRKNRMLEAEIEQLTLELESRDLKLMAMSGEESVC